MSAKQVPEGYMVNALGHLVPRELVAEIDIARDDLVREIFAAAHALQDAMTAFKSRAMGDIAAFVEMSAERYGAELGGDKGNVTLTSYCGRYKILRAVADRLEFDERLQVAKELIDTCIHRWGIGVNAHYRALVMSAFQVDKAGKINTGRVLELTRLAIDDEDWKAAMQAIQDSIQVIGTRSYVRFYERIGGSDKFHQVTLDIAAL